MSLYLSRILLNPRSRRTMGELLHPYEMHRTLMRAFPAAEGAENGNPREKFGVLFRAEPSEEIGEPVKILVQSLCEPDWSFLDAIEGYLDQRTGAPYEYRDIMPFISKIEKGGRFAFRLRANPTKRVGAGEDPMKGKRVELFRYEEQLQWLVRKSGEREKGAPGGFRLLKEQGGNDTYSVKITREGKKTGRRERSGKTSATTHLSVLYEGLLEVSDEKDFFQTVIRGIGPAKAFGFGLLSLAPEKAFERAFSP